MSYKLLAALVVAVIVIAGLVWMFSPPNPAQISSTPSSFGKSDPGRLPQNSGGAGGQPAAGESGPGSSNASLSADPGQPSPSAAPQANSPEGGGSGTAGAPGTVEPHAAEKGASPDSPRPFLEGWDAPSAVLVFSGEQHGYFEPCGCSLKQLGGVSRRADLFRQLAERGHPVAAFDLGGLVNRPSRKQGKLKLQMSLQALRDMPYQGLALGPQELRNGIELITYEVRPPFLACNIVIGGDTELGLVQSHAIVPVGELKVGVTAVFGRSLAPEILAQIEAGEVEVLDPLESLRKAIAALEAEQPDLLVLLAHARGDETRDLAGRFPQLNVVAAIGGPEDPNPRPTFVGQSLWVWPGQKGKFMSVVGLFPGDGPVEKRLRYEPVALDEERFRDTPRMRDHMRHYQEMLQLHRLVENEPAIDHPRNLAETEGNEFVGAESCGECHKKSYAKWKTTGHARGTISIIQGRAGQEGDYISRIQDPECVACHVTGWDPQEVVRYRSGWVSEALSRHLAGQQCENCHGPGGRHDALERLLAAGQEPVDQTQVDHWRNFMHLAVDNAFDLCARCHDGDNDPHFHAPTFPEYWEKIKHPWLD